MSWDVASIYPHVPSSWCHLFCEVHQSLLQQSTPQHDAATPVLHGWDGVLLLASLPLFPPNRKMVIMAKQFYFCFFRQEDVSLSPCAVENRCLAFLWTFWSSCFFLAERPFRLCLYRTRFTVDIDHFFTCFLQHLHKVLCCCSGIDVHFSH